MDLSSMAAMAERAAPKLWPVVMICALGYLCRSADIFLVMMFSSKR